MVDIDDIDKTGVPSQIDETSPSYWRKKLNDYLYIKLNSVFNNEFSYDDLQKYGLTVNSDGEIDISTTKKLINYLKAFVKVSLESEANPIKENITTIFSTLDEKLNIKDYVVDNGLDKNSNHPVSNSFLFNKFKEITDTLDNKSNVGHEHEIEDITDLSTSLNNKSDVGHTHKINDIANLSNQMSEMTDAIDSKNNIKHTNYTFVLGGGIESVGQIYANDYFVYVVVNGVCTGITPQASVEYKSRIPEHLKCLAPITVPATTTKNDKDCFIHIDGTSVYIVNWGNSTTIRFKTSVMYPRVK